MAIAIGLAATAGCTAAPLTAPTPGRIGPADRVDDLGVLWRGSVESTDAPTPDARTPVLKVQLSDRVWLGEASGLAVVFVAMPSRTR